MTHKNRRGFSLIELMVSVVIMAVAVAATASVVVTMMSLTRNAENYTDDLDAARQGGTALGRVVESAGLMTPGGLRVNTGSGPLLINPIFGIDGTTGAGFRAGGGPPAVTGPDDLWVVTPNRNSLREGCVDPGAGVVISRTTAGGVLTVQCPTIITSFGAGDFLVASNSRTGALLSPPLVFSTAGANATIGYAEQAVVNFSPAPPPGEGFTRGDFVYGVTLFHYSIKPSPFQAGRPALVRHRGMLGTEPTTNRPFVEDPAFGDEVVQDLVEDMQVSFGMQAINTDVITYQTSLAPDYNPALTLRSVRINVVAVGRLRDLAVDGDKVVPLRPLVVENHSPPGAALGVPGDGFRRVLYTQRLELPNTAPENL